ncbi:hypothetical protein THASP1DRAFT_22978 [Thamnocephalis sphaerospora]|uniref:Uncharacterized protein n=1 Tax=Thamnocephalis sphaerospora TaxID=78915 RepID=A0A4P9XUL9_9FUNG|nr:hypothetical protein THASP1DRAFT_22978 [Thamnocephalis sphaerospora]|eukprot:RKP09140.1 hypothetical protein THASP1DRAFT_22978 [Thamnocephalis sphaerospora]
MEARGTEKEYSLVGDSFDNSTTEDTVENRKGCVSGDVAGAGSAGFAGCAGFSGGSCVTEAEDVEEEVAVATVLGGADPGCCGRAAAVTWPAKNSISTQSVMVVGLDDEVNEPYTRHSPRGDTACRASTPDKCAPVMVYHAPPYAPPAVDTTHHRRCYAGM